MINIQLNEKFLDDVEKFNEKKFSQRQTLSTLIQLINRTNQFEKFSELIFLSKYVNGLYRSIKISQLNPQITNIESIKKDFIENLQKVSSLLNEIILIDKSGDAETIKFKYINLSETQLEDLLKLIEDFEKIKKYVNYLKRKD